MIARHSSHRDVAVRPSRGAEIVEIETVTADFLALAEDSNRKPAQSGRLSSLVVHRALARELEGGRLPSWAGRKEARALFAQAAASNIILGFTGGAELEPQRDRIFSLVDFAAKNLDGGRRPDSSILDRVMMSPEVERRMLAFRALSGRGDPSQDRIRPGDWNHFFEESLAASESAAHLIEYGLASIQRTLAKHSRGIENGAVGTLGIAAQTIGSRHGFIGFCERCLRNERLMATLRYWSALDAAVAAVGTPAEDSFSRRFLEARRGIDSLWLPREPAIEEAFGFSSG